MPRVLVPGNELRVTIVSTLQNQLALNRFHFRVDGITSGAPTDLMFATSFEASIATPFRAILSGAAFYHGILCQIVFPLPIMVRQEAQAGQGFGTSGADPLPAQACGMTTWLTPFATRSKRARTYWPFASTNDISVTEIPTATYQTHLATLANAILSFTSFGSGGDTGTCVMEIFNPKTFVGTTITGQTARPKWGTQKRRGDYGKTNVSPI